MKTRPSLLDIEQFLSLFIIQVTSSKPVFFEVHNETLFSNPILGLLCGGLTWMDATCPPELLCHSPPLLDRGEKI